MTFIWLKIEDEDGDIYEVERNIYIYWSDKKKRKVKVLDVRVEVKRIDD